MAINSWSYSKLTEFDKCKYRTWLLHDQRVPEPKRPLPQGKSEYANDRGTRIHTAAEEYVRGDRPDLIPELASFEFQIELLAELYAEGMVSMEGEWAVNEEWEPCDWNAGWHRSKVDAIVHHSDTHATVIDYKSGKRYGNEVKHGEQMTLYALNAALRFPLLQEIYTELWYVDLGITAVMRFPRHTALAQHSKFHARGKALTSCTDWKPNPNIYSCQYCMYGPWGSNHCTVGIKR
jgi:hypothetical protein